MARSSNSLLGGRYKLTGELARAASVQRGWDRWLDRQVFIKILARSRIDDCAGTQQFLASARALVRIDHPNVEALLDYGATEEGAPYHVMAEVGADLSTLIGTEGRVSWARARRILLDVIAGVHALHRRRIVHGDISPHTVALFGETARLIDFGDAEQREHDPSAEDLSVDVRGIAALGFTLLTGFGPKGRAWSGLAAALARVEAPQRVRTMLVRALVEPEAVELTTLRRALANEARVRWNDMVDAAAAVAAAAMLSIGLWSSVVSSAGQDHEHNGLTLAASSDGEACEHSFDSIASIGSSEPSGSGGARIANDSEAIDLDSRSIAAVHARQPIDEAPAAAPQRRFESARARVQVGSEAQRSTAVTVHSERLELVRELPPGGRELPPGGRELSPAALVERGIDLTHGRPTPADDPRLPIVDGPLRARALFEAACARNYGKGCHMLGVQIAESMIPDDGAGAAQHYRRGCALDYHRSCAALADLARAGQIVADADRLDAKACRLAGPDSSYCRPRE